MAERWDRRRYISNVQLAGFGVCLGMGDKCVLPPEEAIQGEEEA